jgi:hypothetical protein
VHVQTSCILVMFEARHLVMLPPTKKDVTW